MCVCALCCVTNHVFLGQCNSTRPKSVDIVLLDMDNRSYRCFLHTHVFVYEKRGANHYLER